MIWGVSCRSDRRRRQIPFSLKGAELRPLDTLLSGRAKDDALNRSVLLAGPDGREVDLFVIQLRAKVLDEGANLAFTQRVRIEYALNGGRINIETAAGVDLSDRGVNLKILRGRLQNADCPSLLRRALNHAS